MKWLWRAEVVNKMTTLEPKVGDRVFRIWGDESPPFGESWTRKNPGSVSNYRNEAGLPNQNTGRFVSEGILKNTEGVTQRPALELHNNTGGLDELVIPNSLKKIELTRVSGANPPF